MEQTISKCLQFQPSILFFSLFVQLNRTDCLKHFYNLCRMEVFQAVFFLLNGQVKANFLFQELWVFFNIQKPHVLLLFIHYQYVTNKIRSPLDLCIFLYFIFSLFICGEKTRNTRYILDHSF